MIKYIHGSEDSLDIDTIYVFKGMPTFKECQHFCSDKEENRNIITVENGIVKSCFKGTPDEINNALIDTYYLHTQDHPLIIRQRVERDILMKDIRILRGLLSICSRTQYRPIIKAALKSHSFSERVKALKKIDITTISDFQKGLSNMDILKVFAFQLGQGLGLHSGTELYSKSSVGDAFPELYDFLYRKSDLDISIIQKYLNMFIDIISRYKTEVKGDNTYFIDFIKKINLKTEKYL